MTKFTISTKKVKTILFVLLPNGQNINNCRFKSTFKKDKETKINSRMKSLITFLQVECAVPITNTCGSVSHIFRHMWVHPHFKNRFPVFFFLWFLASVSKPAPDKPAEKSGGFVTQRRVTDVYFGPTSLSALPTRTTNSILVLQSFDMQVSCAECSGLKL